MPAEIAAQVVSSYELPGKAVFPESIGLDPVTGDAYVGSLADGTLYRLTSAGGTELWAAGGQDGRRSSLVNDIAFGHRGEAYVTDSLAPVLLRADGDPVTLSSWADPAAAGVPWPDGLNFNGIVLAPDGRHVVACQTNLGRFWRVDVASGKVSEVALEGGPLPHCDGLAICGPTLFVAVNARNLIAVADLADDGSAGRVHTVLRSSTFAFPTAVAVSGGRLLVVNSQLDKMGGHPRLPFTVVAVAIPETW
jgi:superoxide dismutase, Cu-Zn family